MHDPNHAIANDFELFRVCSRHRGAKDGRKPKLPREAYDAVGTAADWFAAGFDVIAIRDYIRARCEGRMPPVDSFVKWYLNGLFETHAAGGAAGLKAGEEIYRIGRICAGQHAFIAEKLGLDNREAAAASPVLAAPQKGGNHPERSPFLRYLADERQKNKGRAQPATG